MYDWCSHVHKWYSPSKILSDTRSLVILSQYRRSACQEVLPEPLSVHPQMGGRFFAPEIVWCSPFAKHNLIPQFPTTHSPEMEVSPSFAQKWLPGYVTPVPLFWRGRASGALHALHAKCMEFP